MNDIYFEIIRSIAVILIMVLVRYAVPYLKSKIKDSNLSWIYDWAAYAVKAAEQTIDGTKMGTVRKAVVKEFLTGLRKTNRLKLTDEQIENLIESAVYAMKQEGSNEDS